MREPQPEPAVKEDKEQRAVQSIEVGGRLLLALANSPTPLTLRDLSSQSGLPAARAHPYLVSFGKLRLIEQEPETGRYALGPAALQLGLTCLHQLDPVKVALPVAQQLAASTGHAVALAVWGNFGPTIIRMIDAREALHVSMRAGTVMSILGTATGRAFAGVMPLDRIEKATGMALGDPEGHKTPLLKAKARELREAVAELREHGVARAEGKPIPGVNAFSAPVFDHEGEAVIVLTALGHQDNFPAQWDSDAAQAVRDAASEISGRLGWRGAAASGFRTRHVQQ
ncbi:IclR family transcriptional regulator [Variovorax sp. J22R133]|uniref:IclR family transcriptional regulator n=1 Tax=Variovorax brevis TaxID=3053503 RepID=UPI0025760F86|nr:IclR family transcriptional regulator [Variovorax sp. J22R133]MDM0112373.1 IclR family transcriptional regulator [Variovorax sp. J22R133]